MVVNSPGRRQCKHNCAGARAAFQTAKDGRICDYDVILVNNGNLKLSWKAPRWLLLHSGAAIRRINRLWKYFFWIRFSYSREYIMLQQKGKLLFGVSTTETAKKSALAGLSLRSLVGQKNQYNLRLIFWYPSQFYATYDETVKCMITKLLAKYLGR